MFQGKVLESHGPYCLRGFFSLNSRGNYEIFGTKNGQKHSKCCYWCCKHISQFRKQGNEWLITNVEVTKFVLMSVWLSVTDKCKEKSQMLAMGQLMLEVYWSYWGFLNFLKGFLPNWDIISTFIYHLKHTHIIMLHTHSGGFLSRAC